MQRTRNQSLPQLNHSDQFTTTRIDGLTAGTTYRYRLVATNETGTAAGPERTITVTPPSGSAYRSAILTTQSLLGYWRLGEATGNVASSETGTNDGTYSAQGVTLAQPGALSGDPDTAAAFDGLAGEMSAPTTSLSAAGQGTLEGWFDWRSGTALLRDHTTAGGWIWGVRRGRHDAFNADADRRGDVHDRSASYVRPRRLASLCRHQRRKRCAVLRRRQAAAAAADVGRNPRGERQPLARHAQRPLHHAVHARPRRPQIAGNSTALTPADVQRHYEVGKDQVR